MGCSASQNLEQQKIKMKKQNQKEYKEKLDTQFTDEKLLKQQEYGTDNCEIDTLSLNSLDIQELENQTKMRFVNHPRIKQIITEFWERGDEDPISKYKQKLYTKSQFFN